MKKWRKQMGENIHLIFNQYVTDVYTLKFDIQ